MGVKLELDPKETQFRLMRTRYEGAINLLKRVDTTLRLLGGDVKVNTPPISTEEFAQLRTEVAEFIKPDTRLPQ